MTTPRFDSVLRLIGDENAQARLILEEAAKYGWPPGWELTLSRADVSDDYILRAVPAEGTACAWALHAPSLRGHNGGKYAHGKLGEIRDTLVGPRGAAPVAHRWTEPVADDVTAAPVAPAVVEVTWESSPPPAVDDSSASDATASDPSLDGGGESGGGGASGEY